MDIKEFNSKIYVEGEIFSIVFHDLNLFGPVLLMVLI